MFEHHFPLPCPFSPAHAHACAPPAASLIPAPAGCPNFHGACPRCDFTHSLCFTYTPHASCTYAFSTHAACMQTIQSDRPRPMTSRARVAPQDRPTSPECGAKTDCKPPSRGGAVALLRTLTSPAAAQSKPACSGTATTSLRDRSDPPDAWPPPRTRRCRSHGGPRPRNYALSSSGFSAIPAGKLIIHNCWAKMACAPVKRPGKPDHRLHVQYA